MPRRLQPQLAAVAFSSLLLLAACGSRPAPRAALPSAQQPRVSEIAAMHVPPFAEQPFERFSRINVLSIALREWRSFGQPVRDDPPDNRPEMSQAEMPDHQPGLWQRVGEYWWLGQDADAPARAWTSKYDGDGRPIPAGREDSFAWSAAFISYVMRTAGAGAGFPYAIAHATYINAATAAANPGAAGIRLRAEPLTSYAPKPGDLVCTSRTREPVRFSDLPRSRFPGHCDFVIDRVGNEIRVIGGNVAHAVTMKHIPVTAAGLLATPDGMTLDTRYHWFVALRVLYDD
ncbi:DUF2272 domain-containing protein [Rhodovastum atsumiense]|uniref:DUF2272 domain-containing protein n=1 Tax=Rhodovastum atsumiense TaxID=504468 RepID=UPI001EEFDF73|nr:DUF2272 domain-containing protein [Rhodovastum atsumiense]